MWVNEYIRIPFKERGRERDGVDCWGLARLIYRDRLNIDLPSLSEYEHTKDKVKISDIIRSESHMWEHVVKDEEKPYDIAVFRMLGQPMHVSIVVEPGLMIHCERGSGVYLTYYYTEQQWDRRLEGFFRHAKCSGITSTVSSS